MSDLEVFGKAAPGTGSPSKERGDCPFSQRVFLELEELGLPYTATYIQEGPNKPHWFMVKNPSGLMPVLRDGETWIQDSDKIAEYLDKHYAENTLKTPVEFRDVGSKIFLIFTKWLQSKDPRSPCRDEFVEELVRFDRHLQKHDVGVWLDEIGLGSYRQVFKENDVNGEYLDILSTFTTEQILRLIRWCHMKWGVFITLCNEIRHIKVACLEGEQEVCRPWWAPSCLSTIFVKVAKHNRQSRVVSLKVDP